MTKIASILTLSVSIYLSACAVERADSFNMIGFKEVSSQSIIINNVGDGSNYQETDSLYTTFSDDTAYIQNIVNGYMRSYPIQKYPFSSSRILALSVDSDSTLIVAEENKYYRSNHTESFYYLNLKSGEKKRFNWTGAPVTHVDKKLSKWLFKEDSDNKEPVYHLFPNYIYTNRLFRKDSITYPLVLLYNNDGLSRPSSLTGIVKLGFNKPAEFYPALHPQWAFKPKDNAAAGTNAETPTNAWLSDSVMLYSFESYNTIYQFNRYTTKFSKTQPHYQLFPDSISNNVENLQPINVFDNTGYSKLIANKGGNGFLRVGYTFYEDLMNWKPKKRGSSAYLFWHNKDGKIYESALPPKYTSVVGAHGDTLLCSLRSNDFNSPTKTLVKVVIALGVRTTKTEYLKQLAKLRE